MSVTRAAVWRIYLVAGLIAAAVHLGLPDPANSAVFLVVAVSGPVAVLVGLRRRLHRVGWSLILLGTSLMVAGDVLWVWFETVADVDPFPSLADVLYLPGYPLVAAGLLWLLHNRDPEARTSEGLIDATIIARGSGVVSWVFLIEPYVRDMELTVAERAVSAAYPLMGILLVAVVARLSFARAREPKSDALIGLGLGALLIADTYLGVLEITAGYDWNPVPEFLWLAMYVLVGAAALVPQESRDDDSIRLTQDDVTPSRLMWLRLPLLTVASLMAPAVLAWHAIQGHSVNLFIIAAGSAVLFLLVLARVLGLVNKIERQATELTRLASADPLTGLPNRRYWESEIDRLLALTARNQQQTCVAMLDLDHFKRFNDLYGHAAGDHLLNDCGQVWPNHLRATDLLARVGGEEFALALPNCTAGEAERVIERLRAATPEGQTFSCGLAIWDGTESHRAVLARADRALYEAKRTGRHHTLRAPDDATNVAAGRVIRSS